MVAFNTLLRSNFSNIKALRGYRDNRSLISLYIPCNTPIASILNELRNELKRIDRRKHQDDVERNTLISSMNDLIADLETINPETDSEGLVIFYGLDDQNNFVKLQHVPENNARVLDFLLVCDHTFYFDSVLNPEE